MLLAVGVSFKRVPSQVKAIPKLGRPIFSGSIFVKLEVMDQQSKVKNICQ